MVFNFLKRFSLPLFGITGVSSISPVVYEQAISPNYKTTWNKKLIPVDALWECRSRNGWKHLYKFYLTLGEDPSVDLGLGLKIVAVIFGSSGGLATKKKKLVELLAGLILWKKMLVYQ